MISATTALLLLCAATTLASGVALLRRFRPPREAVPLGAALIFCSLLPFGFSLVTLEKGELYSWGLLIVLPGVFLWIAFLSLFGASLGLGVGGRISPAWKKYFFFNLALALIVPLLYIITNYPGYKYLYEGGGYLLLTGSAKYILGYLLLAAALFLVRFEALYRSSAEEERKHLRPFLLFSLVHIFPLAFLACLGILYGAISTKMILMGSLFMGVSSPFMVVESLRKQLLTLEVKIKPQVAYSSGAILVLGLYLILLALVAEGLRRLGGNLQNLFTFLGALVLFFLLLALPLSSSLRGRVSRFVRLNFLSSSRDYRREWSRLSDSLATATEVENLARTACKTLREFFDCDWVAFYLLKEGELKLKASRGENRPALDLPVSPVAIDWIFRHGKAVLSPNLPDEIGFDQESAPAVLSPLLVAGQLLGLVFLGRKKDGKDYSFEDLSLLDTSCRQIAVATLQSLTWERLSESEKLESFHQMASFVLHDLKSAVSTLSLLVSNASKLASDPEAYREGIDSIKRVSDRMKALIHKLSSDLGEGKPHLRKVDLVPIIGGVLSQTESHNDGGVMVKRNFSSPVVVEVDPDMMEMVIHNLIVNAYESMPSGGELGLSVFAEGGKVKLSVKDSGVGMSEEFIRNRLFRPFQSTKRRGLGIGLYQCRKLLESFGGKIEVRSSPHRGTEFLLWLPLVSEKEGGEVPVAAARDEIPSG